MYCLTTKKTTFMKKLLMVMLALAMTTGAFAQKMWIGGTGSLSASGSASVSLVPTFGYFLTEDISVEGRLNLAFNSSNIGVGLTAIGRYWLPINDKLFYTPGLSLGFSHTSYTNGSNYKTSSFDLGLQVGSFHYKINDAWMLGANFSSLSICNVGKHNNAKFNITTSTNISVNYFF